MGPFPSFFVWLDWVVIPSFTQQPLVKYTSLSNVHSFGLRFQLFFMVELLLFTQIRHLANLPSVKLTFKEVDESPGVP